jgi:hypothetical protein
VHGRPARAYDWEKENSPGNFGLQRKHRRLVSEAILTIQRRPVSQDPSRKQFLAKVLGLVAVAGLAPKLLAKPAAPTPAASLQPEIRAVSRRAGPA